MNRQQEAQLEYTNLRIVIAVAIQKIRKLTDDYIADRIQENLRYAKEVGRLPK